MLSFKTREGFSLGPHPRVTAKTCAAFHTAMSTPTKNSSLSEDEEVAALRRLLNSGPRTNRARPAALSPEKKDVLGDSQATAQHLLQLLQDKSGLEEAEPMLRKEMETRKKALGSTNAEALLSVTCLAMLLQAKGDHEGALPLYKEALEGFEKQYGPSHRDTLISVNNLAVLLKSMGNLKEARPLYERVLAGDEAQLGPDHPHTLDSIYNLARLVQAEGDAEKAIPLFKREVCPPSSTPSAPTRQRAPTCAPPTHRAHSRRCPLTRHPLTPGAPLVCSWRDARSSMAWTTTRRERLPPICAECTWNAGRRKRRKRSPKSISSTRSELLLVFCIPYGCARLAYSCETAMADGEPTCDDGAST